MNSCSILFCPSTDLKVSPESDEIRRTCATAAIIKAASYGGFFSIRDVWRELNLGGKSLDAVQARKSIYSRHYLRRVMEDVGVKTSQIGNETAGGRRYFIPGLTIVRGCSA